MGVRGLTTFIAQHANQYLDPHELHDCNLVIDGDNICSQLYRQSDRGLSAFGGNYDEYFRAVVEFFQMLKKCNITPYVLLDGGYEMRKMKTTKERLRARIGVIKHIIPLESYLAIPLLMREVFVSATKSCNVKIYRCLFEADNEIAILARKLNCPVLSYDSDFYIFDGQYIPFVTITPKVYKKTVKSNSFEVEIMRKKQKGQKNIRRKPKKITVEIEGEGEEVEEVTYNYLDCCMYTIENLTDGVLENDMLPLFAIMLGNDFISRKWFAKFFRNVSKRRVKRRKNLSLQQKKIYTLLDWLRHETLRSAIRKILECVKHCLRPRLWYQIRSAMKGYRMVHSKSFEYFGFEEQSYEYEENLVLNMDLDEVMANDDESESENECEEVEEVEETEVEEEDEEEQNSSEQEEGDDGFAIKNSDDDDFKEPDEKLSDEDEEPEFIRRRKFVFPEWFLKIYNSASSPRFLVDILRCRRYINYPQVEEFNGPDSNTISYPILNFLYSILHSPNIPPLYYYTRIPKQVRYEVKKIESEKFSIENSFDPNEKKNFQLMLKIFKKKIDNAQEIFDEVKRIPEAHQLYILAVIYWMKRSTNTNLIYLFTSVIGLIAISIVDRKCEKVHRDSNKFLKNFGTYLKELKTKTNEETEVDDVPLKTLIKNITKPEALLTMENLIKEYEISPKFQRKHADFRRTVVHTFAELQSAVFNLYSLDPFLNYPFDNIKIENYFNGLFLYNMYLSLKSRAQPREYIKNHIFNRSPALMKIFNQILEICKIALPHLDFDSTIVVEDVAKKTKTKTKKSKVKQETKIDNNDCIEDQSDSGSEFNDLNNKFSQLLKL